MLPFPSFAIVPRECLTLRTGMNADHRNGSCPLVRMVDCKPSNSRGSPFDRGRDREANFTYCGRNKSTQNFRSGPRACAVSASPALDTTNLPQVLTNYFGTGASAPPQSQTPLDLVPIENLSAGGEHHPSLDRQIVQAFLEVPNAVRHAV